jgi:hypothetical protein
VTQALGLFEELKPPLTEEEALLEADRCLECGAAHAPAPCAVACPAEIDVPGFVAAIARGDPGRAAELIFAEKILGASCARVCPAEMLCEGACVLPHEGRRPIEIARLQRHACELAAGGRACVLRRAVPARTAPPARVPGEPVYPSAFAPYSAPSLEAAHERCENPARAQDEGARSRGFRTPALARQPYPRGTGEICRCRLRVKIGFLPIERRAATWSHHPHATRTRLRKLSNEGSP